jgi:predicted transcriptional regulator
MIQFFIIFGCSVALLVVGMVCVNIITNRTFKKMEASVRKEAEIIVGAESSRYLKKQNKSLAEEMKETRPQSMSEYTIDFETIDGKQHHYEWQGSGSRFSEPASRTYSHNGLRYMDTGCNIVFIPWHQIKKSSLKEVVLWDDCCD